jgi:predicted sulfurtransferase
METCTVETGLLKKKPCSHNAVTHCANCEQPLCKQHAVAQKAAGKFMCKECDAARRDYEKNTPAAPVKSPVSPAAAPDAAAKHAAPKEAPKAAAQAKVDDGGALEFTPGTEKK